MFRQTKDDQTELFIVVDENDNIIEYRTRYDCHHNPSLTHRAIAVIIYNDKQEILLQKRSQYKDTYPGWYEISAGGHVAKGETYEQAAARELNEELGVSIPLTYVKKFLARLPHETEINAIFEGRSNGPFFPNPDEVKEVKFVSKSRLHSMRNKLTPCAQQDLAQIGLFSSDK